MVSAVSVPLTRSATKLSMVCSVVAPNVAVPDAAFNAKLPEPPLASVTAPVPVRLLPIPVIEPAFVMLPLLLFRPPLIDAPPDTTVRPVRPVNVPLTVELPVIEAPPDTTVRPVRPLSVPLIVELPVMFAPPLVAVNVPAVTLVNVGVALIARLSVPPSATDASPLRFDP